MYKKTAESFLPEMSELGLELIESGDETHVICVARFATMTYLHEKRSYEVGLLHSNLVLTLEGCDAKVEASFGELTSPDATVEQVTESTAAYSVEAGVSSDATGTVDVLGNAAATKSARASEITRRVQSYGSVIRRPNNRWQIRPPLVNSKDPRVLDGTPIPGKYLCGLTRKREANRVSVLGEIVAAKRDFRVKAEGNRTGAYFAELRNKDAVVAQILLKAVRREASMSGRGDDAFVTISRCHVEEE